MRPRQTWRRPSASASSTARSQVLGAVEDGATLTLLVVRGVDELDVEVSFVTVDAPTD